ncbi:hypothetical protein TSUD_250750 [Trifolium subterraneum]|nr:hypothetical protein TSUD_250750 [Trifolium subterraneum]
MATSHLSYLMRPPTSFPCWIQCQSPISMFTSTQTSSAGPNTFPHCNPIDGSTTSILNHHRQINPPITNSSASI